MGTAIREDDHEGHDRVVLYQACPMNAFLIYIGFSLLEELLCLRRPLRTPTSGQGRRRFSVFEAERHNAPTNMRQAASSVRTSVAIVKLLYPFLEAFTRIH